MWTGIVPRGVARSIVVSGIGSSCGRQSDGARRLGAGDPAKDNRIGQAAAVLSQVAQIEPAAPAANRPGIGVPSDRTTRAVASRLGPPDAVATPGVIWMA
jgi:hypothetical protein